MDTKERDEFIRARLNEGVSLSDVQKMLAEEFGISMKYFDLRMLAATLPVDWEKQEKPKKPTAAPAAPAAKPTPAAPKAVEEELPEQMEEEQELEENEGDYEGDEDEPGEEAVPRMVVIVDEEPIRGAAMSGTASLMSGITITWFMDRMGRLGFDGEGKDEVQPTEDDLQAFQVELQRVMQEKAMALRKAAFDGRTKVEVNPVVRPGCELNGTVTFASGIKGEWFLSQGQLDFDLEDENQKPTRADLQMFQMVLSETLRSKGYGR